MKKQEIGQCSQTKPKIGFDDKGQPYIAITKEVYGQVIEVKKYGEQGKRPKKYVR